MQNTTRDEDKTKQQLIDELAGLRRHVGRLTSISEDLDASAYTVAHDLKRSLSLILGFSELLLKEYDTVPREELRRCLQMIVESGHKMNSIVDELMLLIHVRDEESPSVGPLEMGDIVAEAVGRLSYIIQRKQARCNAPDQWPEALGYAPWVEEVWFAFMIEALQFDVEPLHLEAGGSEEQDGMSRFWIRIAGAGFTSEQKARLSQAYHSFQSGLVQPIIEKLGGRFGVAGEAGQACEFYFTLPGKAMGQHLA
jgi:light-regulated signal transduction histidine kinase (bacteriophytochrome)